MNLKDFQTFCAALALACTIALFAVAARASECESPTHCALMELTPWHEDRDEAPEDRTARLLEHARAIDGATDNRTERALLIMTAWKESRFARFVDLDWDKCRLGLHGWCDSGRAFGVIQMHDTPRDISRAEMYRLGIEAMRRAGNSCRSAGDYWEGAVSQYATGRVCNWPESKTRVKLMWKIDWMIGKVGG